MATQNVRMDRLRIEIDQKWSKWVERIPFINFPSDWVVKPCPPFMNAMARFLVKRKAAGGAEAVSVYLDVDGSLGTFGYDQDGKSNPYWEVFPVDEDIERVAMDDVDGLLALIAKSLGHLTP